MGAENIDFKIKGKATKDQINDKFKERRESDSDRNGHQDGYSGDFQTVDNVDFEYLGKVFDSYREAEDFCLDKAKKWETVVAVYYQCGEEVNTLVAGWGAC